MTKKKIGVVIVAGGMSSRMMEFKPLLQLDDKTMIETTVENYVRIGVEEIVVVTGYRSDDIEETLRGKNIKFIKNKNYDKTHMYDSVCIGLMEISDSIDYIFILPADSPFVHQFTLKKLIDEIDNSTYELIQPVYEEEGHPIIINREFYKKIQDHDGTMGIQGVIKNNKKRCGKLIVVDPGILMDADRPDDYFKMLEYSKNKSIPTVEVCKKIQKYFNMGENVSLHSQKVTIVALKIYEELKLKGLKFNINLLIAAGLLHDIAKGKSKHAIVGSQWLKLMGYDEVSQIVMEHMELEQVLGVPTEKEIIFLADKLVQEDQIVTLNKRFEYKEQLYKKNKYALETVKRRKKQAETVYNLLTNKYGLKIV